MEKLTGTLMVSLLALAEMVVPEVEQVDGVRTQEARTIRLTVAQPEQVMVVAQAVTDTLTSGVHLEEQEPVQALSYITT